MSFDHDYYKRYYFDPNTAVTNSHLWSLMVDARRDGATLVAINPYKSPTAARSDWHIAIRPGTDAALALGLMHVIWRDGLEDVDYLARATVGAEQLRRRANERVVTLIDRAKAGGSLRADFAGEDLVLLLIAIGAQLFCGMSSVTANSRMIYAFSRDGALPGSDFWHRVNKRTRTPTNAIWLAAGGALILALPYLWNGTAYAAVTSIAVIGLYIAYVLPTFLRLRQGADFKRGPWHLGRWSYLVGTIAVIWVIFITILFMLPTASPITVGNFNYTVVAVLVVLGFAGIYWMVSAKNWFKGPKVQGSAAELAAIERELSA